MARAAIAGDGRSPAADLTWSAWVEDFGAPFRPVTHLHPNSEYQFVLDLSAISYQLSGGGVSRAAGSGFMRLIGEWLKDDRRERASFKVLILPDPAYFDSPQKRVETLQFSLSRLKEPAALLADAGGDPFEILRAKPEASFRLGHVAFNLHTRTREGMGAIGLSLWDEGQRPVDELIVPYCISTDEGSMRCKPSTRGTVSLHGLDSVRIATEAGSPADGFPDAALHFLQLDSDQVVGVLRRNNWEEGRFESWPLGRSAAELREFFEITLLPAFSATTTEDGLRKLGVQFYNLLFPPPGPEDAAEAGRSRDEFETFVREHLSDHAASATEHLKTPSIFIRMLPQDSNSILLIPLGLMAVKAGQGRAEFLGFHFRIEAPLQVQNYQPAPDCISTWALVVPPSRGDLQEVRARFDQNLASLKEGAQYFYDQMEHFGTYLGDGGEENGAAVVVLSHHNRNQIWFSSGDLLLSTVVRRKFQRPSLAILDGCSTGAPGAVDFIRQFNRLGIASVIATSTGIRPEIAADFLKCLASELEDHKDRPDYRLSYAYLNAIECLSDRSLKEGEPKYGPLALTYSLLGNGNVKLCGPKKRPE